MAGKGDVLLLSCFDSLRLYNNFGSADSVQVRVLALIHFRAYMSILVTWVSIILVSIGDQGRLSSCIGLYHQSRAN